MAIAQAFVYVTLYVGNIRDQSPQLWCIADVCPSYLAQSVCP